MMTEKRYTTMWKPETTFSRFWIVRENWERKLNANDVVDLLNELHEQIERLKENFKALDEVKCELADENEQLKFENNELKCALALNEVDYIIADGKKINIPPYYEFKQRYDCVMHRREYDGYD